MFNAQTYAVQVERMLLKRGLSGVHSADTIRENPVLYLHGALDAYRKNSNEFRNALDNFWEKYDKYENMSFDQLGEDLSAQLVADLSDLFAK